MIKYLMILTLIFITGCSTVSTSHRPNSYYNPKINTNEESLFSSTESSFLADKDISRILNYQLRLPKKNRIAILRLSDSNSWHYYSNDFIQLNESIASDFIGQLRRSPRIYDASFLSSLLIPEKRTLAFLREAAARYQADLLLVYRSNCRTFEKYKFIDANETKAYCSVEAVLLDVRSGIIPFSVVSSNEFFTKKKEDDTNFNETIKKAEITAIAKSLKEIASRINNFLNVVERL